MQKQQFDRDGTAVEPPAYLLRSGTEDPNQLANPVYSPDMQCVLLWVAAVLDNRATAGPDGSIVNGNTLDPDTFDTTYIRCRYLPVLPEESWSEMLVKGTYKEWDQLRVLPVSDDQEEILITGAPEPVITAGFARKINFMYGFSVATPRTDRIPPGI